MPHARFNRRFYCIFSILILCTAVLIGCTPKGTENDAEGATNKIKATISEKPNARGISELAAKALSENFWEGGARAILATRDKAAELKSSIDNLLAQPNEKKLVAAQQAWQETFIKYHALLPYFYAKHPTLNESLAQWSLTLAANPIQPGYLDSYDIYTQSGLTNDITIVISAEALRKNHRLTDEEEILLGLYAIEYLLWGDKATRSPELFQQQQKVPLAFAQAGLKVNELPQNRRRLLLSLQAELLLSDLNQLFAQWQEGGLLNTIYFQLTPIQRLEAQYKGLAERLDVIQTNKPNPETNTEENNQESTNTLFEKRSLALTETALSYELKKIDELFFSTTRLDQQKEAIALASDFLNRDEKEKIQTQIQQLKDIFKIK